MSIKMVCSFFFVHIIEFLLITLEYHSLVCAIAIVQEKKTHQNLTSTLYLHLLLNTALKNNVKNQLEFLDFFWIHFSTENKQIKLTFKTNYDHKYHKYFTRFVSSFIVFINTIIFNCKCFLFPFFFCFFLPFSYQFPLLLLLVKTFTQIAVLIHHKISYFTLQVSMFLIENFIVMIFLNKLVEERLFVLPFKRFEVSIVLIDEVDQRFSSNFAKLLLFCSLDF